MGLRISKGEVLKILQDAKELQRNADRSYSSAEWETLLTGRLEGLATAINLVKAMPTTAIPRLEPLVLPSNATIPNALYYKLQQIVDVINELSEDMEAIRDSLQQ